MDYASGRRCKLLPEALSTLPLDAPMRTASGAPRFSVRLLQTTPQNTAINGIDRTRPGAYRSAKLVSIQTAADTHRISLCKLLAHDIVPFGRTSERSTDRPDDTLQKIACVHNMFERDVPPSPQTLLVAKPLRGDYGHNCAHHPKCGLLRDRASLLKRRRLIFKAVNKNEQLGNAKSQHEQRKAKKNRDFQTDYKANNRWSAQLSMLIHRIHEDIAMQ